MPSVRIIGTGRAGGSFAGALGRVGWQVELIARGEDVAGAAEAIDLVLICTPDDTIAEVARAIAPASAVVGHVAGSLGLDVLDPHPRRAGVHPLISLPNAELGSERLLDNGWFAVAGHPLATTAVKDLGGRMFTVADADRAVYHAAACVAANHVVALLGQVERLAAGIGVPADAYLDLTRASVENVGLLGAAEALTGPAARGDDSTIARHLDHLPPDEREAYDVMVREARRLARSREGG